jgi:MoxR-like ATPase
VLGRVYYERVVTSRTQATDLLWNFDALRRLRDSTAGQQLPPTSEYVEPGLVWWAFDPISASKRGSKVLSDPGANTSGGDDAVLLLDEIDKADPDVPNDLLEPFDEKTFTVRETSEPVKARRNVLLFFTTNRERELPQAFLRRCSVLAIKPPSKEWFVDLAKHKFGEDAKSVYDQVADKIVKLREAADKSGQRPPGAAEFLDALEACRQLGINGQSEAFDAVVQATAWKQLEPRKA